MKVQTICSAALIAAVASLQAATWDNGGDQATWESANNWNPNGVVGSLGNTETAATIAGLYNVSLNSDITKGALSNTVDLNGGAILTVGSGAVLPRFAALRVDESTTYADGSTVIFNGGRWMVGASDSDSRISIGKDARVTGTSKLQINGGTISNQRTGSNSRIDIGNSTFTGTAVLEITGGALTNSSYTGFAGAATGNAQLLISGGSVKMNDVRMYTGTSDGFDALLQVSGNTADISFTTLGLYKNATNTNGSSVVSFIAGAGGVSMVDVNGALNLGAGDNRGALVVDLSAYHPGIAGDTLVLFEYNTLSGTFASTNITLGENTLSCTLNYAYQGNKIALVNMTHVPLQLETRPVAALTETTAGLVAGITYVDPGGADLRIYYGAQDGGDQASNWQTNVWVGSGLLAGVHTGLVAGLEADHAYYCRAFATHGGTSVWAETSESFATRFSAGMAPINLTARGGWDRVDLAWDESFNTESGMVVERGTNAIFSGDVTRWFVAGSSTTGTVDTVPVAGMTSYYRVAATNTAGLSVWSDVAATVATASVVVVTQVTLSPSSVFDLQEETRKMALRGTREATVSAWIAGVEVDLAKTNAFHDYGAPTNSSWYVDPRGTAGTTLFRESYEWPFDFGNGVVTNLELVPVFIDYGGSWDYRILLNLGYTGEISIDGTDYIVNVVQGASPVYKDRLRYPGYFNDPAVNVLLYEKATTNRIPNIGRMKFINGVWYSFDSNASGEQLTVSRMVGMGTLQLEAGPFQSNDLAFISGNITHERGWGVSLPDLTFSNATTILPAGKYEFSECTIRNAGKTYKFVYHPSIQAAVGRIDVPSEGTEVMTIGQNYDLRVWLKNYKNPNRLHDYLWMDCQLIDTDMGAAVVPEESEWMKVIESRNSTGAVVLCKWSLPHGCGWNGAYLFTDDTRIDVAGSPFALPTDYNPPAVYDTRTLRIGATMTGLYGPVYTNVPFNVVNERKGFRARYYDFDEALDAFPDVDDLLPDLERLETGSNQLPATAVADPWPGLPPEMADTFGVRYDFDFYQDSSTLYKAPANYSVYLKCQGASRVYWDDELIAENVSHDAVTEVSAPLPSAVALDSYHRVRIEYFHNEGPSMLEVRLSGTIMISISPPYPMPVTHYFRPGERWNVSPAYVPAALSVTGPAATDYTAPASFTVSAAAQHPDGVGNVQVYVDGVQVATDTTAPFACDLTDLPVNAGIAVRAEDLFGYGVASNLNLTIARESLEAWLARNGLSDPDGDGDQDGISNRDEFAADTCPTNAASGFVITDVMHCGNSNCVSWIGAMSPLVMDCYELQATPDLMTPWNTVGVIGLGSSDAHQFWDTQGSNRFYRVHAVPR